MENKGRSDPLKGEGATKHWTPSTCCAISISSHFVFQTIHKMSKIKEPRLPQGLFNLLILLLFQEWDGNNTQQPLLS
jgi:hypothetical protein